MTDIFAECCLDYDRNSEITKNFYAMIQNKFHFAITGNTAAEIIHKKADKTAENMGLTTWKNAPDGRILKQDVIIAKNYLDEKEIKQLEPSVRFFMYFKNGFVEIESYELNWLFEADSVADEYLKFFKRKNFANC